jgi:hypothetical protein
MGLQQIFSHNSITPPVITLITVSGNKNNTFSATERFAYLASLT